MSYILDALKRADTERTRGAVPGLHARQLPGAGNVASAHTHKRVWLLMTGAAALAAMAVGLWVWRAPTEVPGMPAPLAAAPVALPTPVAAPAPMPAIPALVPAMPAAPAPLAPAANTRPRTAPPAQQATAQTPSTVAPNAPAVSPKAAVKAVLAPPMGMNPARNAATTPANPANATTITTANASAPASAVVPPAAQASAPPSAPPIAPVTLPLLSELPDALRRQLPALTITGTVYAEDPKQRLLLVNNQVLPQGSVLAPELTLEEIRPRSSVFNFRGTRFRVAH